MFRRSSLAKGHRNLPDEVPWNVLGRKCGKLHQDSTLHNSARRADAKWWDHAQALEAPMIGPAIHYGFCDVYFAPSTSTGYSNGMKSVESVKWPERAERSILLQAAAHSARTPVSTTNQSQGSTIMFRKAALGAHQWPNAMLSSDRHRSNP